jgi:PAS domain S-box-containing protein
MIDSGQREGTDRPIGHPEIRACMFEVSPDATLVVDPEGRIVDCNGQAERLFGYAAGELLGQLVEVLVPARLSGRHVADRQGYMEAPRARPMGTGRPLVGRRKDGSEVPVDILLSPLETESGIVALAVVRDVTERRRAEALAQTERETHLRELHHRIKNNLQVISSLLFLQSRHTNDPVAVEVLKESQRRVNSIALIHEKLYRSREVDCIDFAEYVRDLVGEVFQAYGVHEAVAARIRVEDVSLGVDTAIPCGLIINELVSNVLKHAFPDGRRGEVQISLAALDSGDLLLTVADDGIGLPEGFDWRVVSSLGLKLVMDLTRQLDGQVEVDRDAGGTRFRIRFKELQYKERG